MNENEIIIVKQLPVIVEQLAQVKSAVLERVQTATSLICTEETVKSVKEERAKLNKELAAWEEKRKEVKAAVTEPYNRFESIYKDCISNTYKEADKELKTKIDAVENELKAKKEKEVVDYFSEYCESNSIDFVTFGNTGISITLSASVKSLKERVKAFVDKIVDDLALIDVQENKAEILVEYKRSLNVSQAITSVTARLRAVEEEKARQEEAAARKSEMEKQREETKVTLTPPVIEAPKVEVPEPVKPTKDLDEILTLSFKVTDTRIKLIELKKFLDNGGYKYE